VGDLGGLLAPSAAAAGACPNGDDL
jgi:hypothetical protein